MIGITGEGPAGEAVAALALDNVSFAYPGGAAVLAEASLSIEAGAFAVVRGPSGAGKSTLLRLLCGLEEPDSGRILFSGEPVAALPPPVLRRSVAYVQQMPTLLHGTVRENLLLPFSYKANAPLAPPDDAAMRARLEELLLDGVTPDTAADRLSVGQAQRVCLTRSLLLNPEVVLLDEPTASLDAESARVVLDLAATLSLAGVTVVMISHSGTLPKGATSVIEIADRKLRYA